MKCNICYGISDTHILLNWNRADGGLAPTEGGSQDGITGGPKNPQQIAAHRRLQQTQAQVEEVIIYLLLSLETIIFKL